jgi:GTPase-associated protein 1, N-terminal domain type 1
MAHELNNSNIRVHQALHGYTDGHRLLACSTTLKPRDQKTMLIMSDVSGPNAVIGDTGYITGYPLSESGVYALACTWAATEISRPGCVWTHTLLLDFADLAVLPTMRFLVNAFRRPTVGFSASAFEAPIRIERPGRDSPMHQGNEDFLRHAVWALYEHPKDRIIASKDETSLESAFLLWAQQWPRLRRTFRFCTLAFGDRSSEGTPFDLQFIPARERSVRARFSGLTDAERQQPMPTSWMEAALTDLFEGTDGKLRKFLREVGGDLAGGREAFVPLCRLHQLMAQLGDRENSVEEAVELLDGSFDAASANSLRTMFVTTIARHPAVMGDRALSFVLNHLDLLAANDLHEAGAALGRSLWAQEPEALVKLLRDPPPRQLIAEKALAALSVDDLIQGLRRSPQSIPGVLACRPELTEERDLWRVMGNWWEEGLALAARRPDRGEAALTAMLAANRNDVVFRAVQTFGSTKVLRAVWHWASAATMESDAETISAWLAASVRDGDALAEVLSADSVPTRAFLTQIARMTYPDLVPNNVGEDPWWTSVHQTKDNLDDRGRQYLSAYLLARAFGHRSHNQAELIEFSFDDVYIPASQSRLFVEAWNIVEPRLPRPWFFDWDYCRRLQDALVDVFVDRELSPIIFTRVTRDDEVFAQLTSAVARTGRGRRFLKKALQSLINQSGGSKRSAILQNAI